MPRSPTVLIVDDDPSIRQTMDAIVRAAGMRSLTCSSGEEALKTLHTMPVDLMLLDVQLPGLSGLDVLRHVADRQPDVGVVMLSVLKEVPTAVEAMRLGAIDYVTKDFSPAELAARVRKSLDAMRTSRELLWRREEMSARPKTLVLGRSAKMRAIAATAEKLASKPVTVLITGESGTGKEVLARFLHEHSERRSEPFIAVNLPALPRELVESELFGHERGAFTGAHRQRLGKFELANGGTLFLDEIGELKPEVQAKLLRALQEREIERVGGGRPIPLDVRVVAATNRPLEKMVQDGQFREDLYWRLKVVPIEMPPLREHLEDVHDLAEHFLALYASTYGRELPELGKSASAILERYQFPGNVRELENMIQRLVVMCDSPVIEASDLPLELAVATEIAREAEREPNFSAAIVAFEKGYLRKMLARNGWKKRKTAEQLGIGFSTLKAKLKSYGIAGPDGEED